MEIFNEKPFQETLIQNHLGLTLDANLGLQGKLQNTSNKVKACVCKSIAIFDVNQKSFWSIKNGLVLDY